MWASCSAHALRYSWCDVIWATCFVGIHTLKRTSNLIPTCMKPLKVIIRTKRPIYNMWMFNLFNSTIHCPLALLFIYLFLSETSSRTLIPLFRLGSVHSGSAIEQYVFATQSTVAHRYDNTSLLLSPQWLRYNNTSLLISRRQRQYDVVFLTRLGKTAGDWSGGWVGVGGCQCINANVHRQVSGFCFKFSGWPTSFESALPLVNPPNKLALSQSDQ